MGGVYQDPARHVWRLRSPQMKQDCLISFANPIGVISINNMEICAHLVQIALFYPHMAPLAHILTVV